MIIAYTGNGKGKTSACLGQVLRALGNNLNIAFIQFLKKGDVAGEQKILQELLKDDFYAGGLGFFFEASDAERHRTAALECLNITKQKLLSCDIVIADEILYALEGKLIHFHEMEEFLSETQKLNSHLVISGRGLPKELYPLIDTITSMEEIKHPWQCGQSAVRGIDF